MKTAIDLFGTAFITASLVPFIILAAPAIIYIWLLDKVGILEWYVKTADSFKEETQSDDVKKV